VKQIVAIDRELERVPGQVVSRVGGTVRLDVVVRDRLHAVDLGV